MTKPVHIGHGPKAVEDALLDALDEILAEAEEDLSLLAAPLRIVVPSRSLRLHLNAAIARRRGRAALGLRVQTLYAAALEIVEGAGETPRPRDPLFHLLTRRLAAEESALADPLEGLEDGYRTTDATVRDLLDAGFESSHAEPCGEALTAWPGPTSAKARGHALVRVADGLLRGAAILNVERSSHLLMRATELLATNPERLPCRALWVHGFADATGTALDFLEGLLRRPGSRLWLDLPPDPATLHGPEPAIEHAYAGQLLDRLGDASDIPSDSPIPPAPEISLVPATGLEAEVREVARRARQALDEGAVPETVAVVMRDPAPYRLTLRRHLRALGVPFSGLSIPGSLTAPGRRARALAELLRRGAELPADRWLDATLALSGQPLAGRQRMDLRLAFFALGAGRLKDIATLEIDRFLHHDSYPLPVRQGLRPGASAEAKDEGEAPDETAEGGSEAAVAGLHAARRRVSGEALRAAVAAAAEIVQRLANWPAEAPTGQHLDRLRSLLEDCLGWREESLFQAISPDVPPALVLTFGEIQTLLGPSLESTGFDAFGGRGGGVQVLTVVEARGRTFEHLFLIGLNGGVFPRTVREDPLLRDDVRLALASVLPDIPLKSRGFDEERYLFAQLLAASPRITLSWAATGADERALSPSPLLERLIARWGERAPGSERAPGLYSPDSFASEGAAASRPPREHVALAALHGRRETFRRLLPIACGEALRNLPADGSLPSIQAETWATARSAVLGEFDPDRRTPAGRRVRDRLGPYFGFIGRRGALGDDDPRHKDLWVTTLEGLASCPWQVFLEKLLRLEPTPDPLQSLPEIDALILGNVIHRVLEGIVRQQVGEDGPGDGGMVIPWPDDDELRTILRRQAERLVEEDGVALKGMAKALAARAWPYLETAQKAAWTPPPRVLAAEEVDDIRLPAVDGEGIRVRFKADRVEPVAPAEGSSRMLTDYKTGRAISTGKMDKTRRKHFLQQIVAGRRLQAVAYALASGTGRYLFLKPDLEHREFRVEAADGEVVAAFGAAARTAFGAWDAGSFFPRVVDPSGRKEPILCSFCAVAEACLRGDSGSRLRLHRWAEDLRQPEEGEETALLKAWDLAEPGRVPLPSDGGAQ
ncbi:MAG: PD-(D/E)XK nuclease family protein [Acidobacteriota bacterium]